MTSFLPQGGQFKHSNGILAPNGLERVLKQFMRPCGRAAGDPDRHPRCGMRGQLVGEEGSNAVDAQKGFVEAVR